MNNRYYIIKVKTSSNNNDGRFVYAFKDSFYNDSDESESMFSVDGELLLIESPADAIVICTMLNKKFS
jgi:hypothetical protein